MQPSPQAFSARSFLDSTMSCDVTERYSPSAPSQYCQIKYGGLSCQVAVTSAGSWKPVFGTGRVSIYMCMPKRQTKFRFLKYGSAKPSFVQLKRTFWTFTRSNNLYQTIDELLSSISANESLHEEFTVYGLSSKPCKRGNKANVHILSKHLRYGISGHLQAFANVLKRHIKSVSPKKRNTKGRCCRFWFNS